MALIDNSLVISNGSALTGSGIVGVAINFTYSDVGSGKDLELILIPTVTGTGATASNSFYYELRTADTTAGLAAGTVVWQSGVIPGTSHVAGVVAARCKLPDQELKARIALYAVEAGTATVTLAAFIVGEGWQNGMGLRTAITAAS